MARKANRTLLAAASAAIAAVYAVGVLSTHSAAEQPAASPAQSGAMVTAGASPAPVATTQPIDTPTQIARAIAAASITATPVSSPATAASSVSRYHDGTFTGTGTSRRGDISVEVTVAGGQITAVKITHSTTYYPISDIARLPGQVVSQQSAAVSFVSGATESSKAFRGAVNQALAQASSSALLPSRPSRTANAV